MGEDSFRTSRPFCSTVRATFLSSTLATSTFQFSLGQPAAFGSGVTGAEVVRLNRTPLLSI